MRVNRQQLADVLGITVPTVTAWVADGLPYAQMGARGKEWVFETADVIGWYAEVKHKARDGRAKASPRPAPEPAPGSIAPRETIDEASLRKESALADKHEIAAAQQAGLLVPVDEVAAIVSEENARVRARICSIPNELRPVLLTHLNNDRKAVEQCVNRAEGIINEALAEIQAYAADDEADGE